MGLWITLFCLASGSFLMGLAVGLTKGRSWAAFHKLCFAWGLFIWFLNGVVLAHKLGLI